MTKNEFLSLNDEQILAEIRSLLYLFSHQEIIRHGLDRDGEEFKSQSVSEHIYNMMTLCQYFLPLEDPGNRLDKAKITQLILWHDIEEIETGDIPKHHKTSEHEAHAPSAFVQTIRRVPTSLKELISYVYEEYEARETPESRFVKALDATEANIEDFKESSKKRLSRGDFVSKDDLQLFSKLAGKATKDFPCMYRIIKLRYENDGNCPSLL
jgi:putative hydrolase of HD superfamily